MMNILILSLISLVQVSAFSTVQPASRSAAFFAKQHKNIQSECRPLYSAMTEDTFSSTASDPSLTGLANGASSSIDDNAAFSNAIVPGVIGALALSALVGNYHLVDVLKTDATSLWHSYNHILESAPIATKAVTSGTVYTIGDIIAQKTESGDDNQKEFDALRTFRSMMAGLCGHGILSHFWYNISESIFVDHLQWTAWWSTVPKIALDQMLWGPIWNSIYILMIGAMRFENPKDMINDVRRSTIPLFVSGLKLWPLAHVVTYGLLPIEHRLLWVDSVEILWVTILATQANSLANEHEPVEEAPIKAQPLLAEER